MAKAGIEFLGADIDESGKPLTYLLKMTQEEIEFLRAVIQRVAGDPDSSPRKYSDAISRALDDVRVIVHNAADKLASGSIRFDDYPKPFVPGFYRGTLDTQDVRWFRSEPVTADIWERVTVTPAGE